MNTLFIGMNDKDLHKQVIDADVFYAAVGREFESCTVYEAIGFYKGEREKSLKIEVFGLNHEICIEIARRLCVELNQETIIVDGEFIAAA